MPTAAHVHCTEVSILTKSCFIILRTNLVLFLPTSQLCTHGKDRTKSGNDQEQEQLQNQLANYLHTENVKKANIILFLPIPILIPQKYSQGI